MTFSLVALSALCLHAGDVCNLSNKATLIVPGKLNWVLKDPSFSVPAGTRALVVRMNPESTENVAEIKVFDGTNRLGWISNFELVPIIDEFNFKPVAKVLPDGSYTPNYGLPSGLATKPRRISRSPDFSEVDMAIGSMADSAIAQARMDQLRIAYARQNNMIPFSPMAGGSSNLGSGSRGVSHLCGAVTKTTNGPCRRPVIGPGYCYQHSGQ